MNEKLISELALKSLIVVGDYSYCQSVMSANKFAELIIKECIKLIEPRGEHRTEPNSYLGGPEGVELLDITVETIKQHFGIE
jgi:hypothetical protein